MSRVLKLSTLTKLGACKYARAKFQSLFGRSVQVTEALCVEHAADVDWAWAARYLLSPAASAEYDRVTASALAEYKRVTALALAEYKRVTALAWAEYKRVMAPVLAEYKRANGLASAEYERARALAWARAYIGDTSPIE